ncbi:MAG: hypothetical protein ACE5OZ_26440 [Candidatus Heimdallarchaeota archaeon]
MPDDSLQESNKNSFGLLAAVLACSLCHVWLLFLLFGGTIGGLLASQFHLIYGISIAAVFFGITAVVGFRLWRDVEGKHCELLLE